MSSTIEAKVVVIGSGPGGYSAAFRAADLLGEGVVMVERYEALGGVCLNVGCIPSKALLHTSEVMEEAEHLADMGITLGKPKVDLKKLRAHKEGIINRLSTGIAQMAKMRKVKVVTGTAQFKDDNTLVVTGKDNTTINFQHCIIAAGSEPVSLPFMPDDERVMDSTGALELKDVPKKMLALGGGIIGMEMAQVYHALGAEIDVVEMTTGIFPGVDRDVVAPLMKRLEKRYNFMFETKVVAAEAKKDGIYVTFEGKNAPAKSVRYDRVLSAVGRIPNGKKLGLENTSVKVDERGFIPVGKDMRTNVPHIFAIGDIVGQPMLAHKAVPEGRVAAEVIAGKKHVFDPRCIPNVAYTSPEIAWVGVTEAEAKEQGIDYGKGVMPWAASGRAIALGGDDCLTKMIFDNKTHRIIGAGICGRHAGDLIGEVALAIEMGAEAEDIALTVHPHPTLIESLAIATEVYEGTATDLPNKKR